MKAALILMAAAAGLALGGCQTMQGLTPCEKAVLAKYAAEKIINTVCPLTESATSEEGIY